MGPLQITLPTHVPGAVLRFSDADITAIIEITSHYPPCVSYGCWLNYLHCCELEYVGLNARVKTSPHERTPANPKTRTMPDTPCIAICSTTNGDDICKGCGRTFEEVTNWVIMTDEEKAVVWQRIDTERTALRYTTYKDRAK